ncbi:unnamed protein product [Sphagnum troendelagicum]|uniref:Uncharacterized protein n=1 Tax=Sphagnum troendelagicum TaxID=128251 RepID=A0ABP0UFK0_9BRYO
MVEDANHLEVCKPPSKEHPSYTLLLDFIITCGKVERECDQPLQEESRDFTRCSRETTYVESSEANFLRKLEYLPSGVVDLTSLQVLDMTGCDLTWAEHTPSGMARAESFGHVYRTIGALLEDICRLVALTELSISGEIGPVVELPHNISALTKLKVLRTSATQICAS